MKKLCTILLTLLLSLIALGRGIVSGQAGVRGSGRPLEEKREVSDRFDQVVSSL